MTISDEAVEAAAIAWSGPLEWLAHSDEWRDDRREDAKSALEAAAPYMLAPVIDLADELAASKLGGDTYRDGRGSGFRIAGIRIRQVLGLAT